VSVQLLDNLEAELARKLEELEQLKKLKAEVEKRVELSTAGATVLRDLGNQAMLEFLINTKEEEIGKLKRRIKKLRTSLGLPLKHIGLHLYLGEKSKKMLQQLADHYNMKQSEFVRVIIKKLYEETFGENK